MRNMIILVAFAGAVVMLGSSSLRNRIVQRLDDADIVVVHTGSTQSGTYTWTGHVAPGQTIEIKGINGDVRAERSDGTDVEVVVEKSGHRSDPAQVRIQAIEHSGGVTLCAMYPSAGRRSNVCAPGEGGRMNVRNNDIEVNFVVRVPTGVSFVGRTVNGDISADGLTAEAFAKTVNGDVQLTTTGLGRAVTVNGDIDASVGDVLGGLSFETVNGDLTIALPAGINAEVQGQTVGGDIESDFPLTIRGQFGPRQISGVLGSGGPRISLQNVNGEIRIVRRN